MGVVNKGLYTDSERLAGEIPGHHPSENTISKNAENDINFGRAVMKGTADIDGKIVAGASSVFVGVARRSKDASREDSDGIIEGYEAGDVLALVEAGLVVVEVTEAVTPSDTVRIVHTAFTSNIIGQFRKTAEAGKSSVLAGAKFAGTTTAAGRVALELGGSTEFAISDDT